MLKWSINKRYLAAKRRKRTTIKVYEHKIEASH